MPKTNFAASVLVTAAFFFVSGSFQAADSAVAAPLRPATLSVRTHASVGRHSSSTHVYLMRGFLNVFSLGMDSLAAELQSRGIAASVANHTQWRSVADEIASNYKAGQRGPIVLIGHSFGADAVMSMGEYLGQMGVPVSLIVPFDGTSAHAASANVARVLNLYKNSDAKITRGVGFHGEITNFYVSDPLITHTSIDDDERLHTMVINKIRGVRSAGLTVANPS